MSKFDTLNLNEDSICFDSADELFQKIYINARWLDESEEFDWSDESEEFDIEQTDEADWEKEPLEYDVSLMNAEIAAERLKELIKFCRENSLTLEPDENDLIRFFGDRSETMKFLAFQEYEGSMNPEAISTFFKYAYCFNKDFDDLTMDTSERFLIWFSGYGLSDKIQEWTESLGDMVAIALSNPSNSSCGDNNVRISAWRIIELV